MKATDPFASTSACGRDADAGRRRFHIRLAGALPLAEGVKAKAPGLSNASRPRILNGMASEETATVDDGEEAGLQECASLGRWAQPRAARAGRGAQPIEQGAASMNRDPGSGRATRRGPARGGASTSRPRRAGPARDSTGCVPHDTVRKKSNDRSAPPTAATRNARAPVSAPISMATSANAMSSPTAPASGLAKRHQRSEGRSTLERDHLRLDRSRARRVEEARVDQLVESGVQERDAEEEPDR